MTQISEEIKRKINESMMMTGGNTPEEKALWEEGVEYGYGLAQEEIDRLRNSGVKHILEQANEIEVLKDTIESQAGLNKSLEDFADRLDKKIYEVIELKETIESQAKEIGELRHVLRFTRQYCEDDEQMIEDIDNLLTPKP